MTKHTSVLYILQADRYFKIGYSTVGVASRISAMQTGNPFKLKPVLLVHFKGTFAANCETTIHTKYANKRMYGEWFVLNCKDVKDIELTLSKNVNFINCTTPNKAIDIDNSTKDNYWKYRYTASISEVQRMNHAAYQSDAHWVNRIDYVRANNKLLEKEIAQLRGKNKKLRADIKEATKLAEEHTFTQIIEQLQFIKRAVTGK